VIESDAYTVAVLGFGQTERAVLKSMIGLSARRGPRLTAASEFDGRTPDIYLVDTDNAGAVDHYRRCTSTIQRPTILIGSQNLGMKWPRLDRPLHWKRLFQALDHAISSGASPEAVTSAPAYANGSPVPGGAAVRDWTLVVDDSVTVREFMKSRLAQYRINIDFAASGEEAIGLTGRRHYVCVFLDVVMPGMDGYQVCKLIKARKGTPRTAVVMLTSKSSPFDRIRGTMAGCDAYLTKPVDEDRLLETIAKYLPEAATGSGFYSPSMALIRT
jgi:twitching motility two-component system response regulator PilG